MLHCLWFSANRQSFEILLISLKRPPFEIAFKWPRYAKMLPIFCMLCLEERNSLREKREGREGVTAPAGRRMPHKQKQLPQAMDDTQPSSILSGRCQEHLSLFPSSFHYGMLSTMYPQAPSWLLQGIAGGVLVLTFLQVCGLPRKHKFSLSRAPSATLEGHQQH